jgi:cell division protein FtsA
MSRGVVTSLDVGTTKVCTLVGDVGEDGSLTVMGVGEAPCEGVERGLVVNLEATMSAIEASSRAAEKMAGLPVRSVVTGIAGEHVRSFNSTGVIGVARRDREITREDVQRVLEAARAVAIPGDRELLHVLPQGFTVDAHPGIEDPVGMTAVRLEAEVHIVTVQATAARNLLRAIDRAGLQVESVILQPLAAAQAAVAEDERALGVALLDMGGGTTDVAVFHKGAVRHTATIGYGGRAVSHDLAVGLRTPVEQAERLKLLHGHAIAGRVDPMRTVEVPGVGGRDARPEAQRELARIIEPRVTEILTLALEEIERVIDRSLLAGGVVLTGGVARMPGLVELAERVLQLPVRIGYPMNVQGVADLGMDPRLSAGVGLLHHAAQEGRFAREGSSLLDRVARPVRDWLKTNFARTQGVG